MTNNFEGGNPGSNESKKESGIEIVSERGFAAAKLKALNEKRSKIDTSANDGGFGAHQERVANFDVINQSGVSSILVVEYNTLNSKMKGLPVAERVNNQEAVQAVSELRQVESAVLNANDEKAAEAVVKAAAETNSPGDFLRAWRLNQATQMSEHPQDATDPTSRQGFEQTAVDKIRLKAMSQENTVNVPESAYVDDQAGDRAPRTPSEEVSAPSSATFPHTQQAQNFTPTSSYGATSLNVTFSNLDTAKSSFSVATPPQGQPGQPTTPQGSGVIAPPSVAPSSEPSSPTPESISVAPQGQPASPVTPSNEVREATEWEQGEKALLKKMRDDKEAVEWEKGEAALAKNLHDVEKLKKQMEDAEKRMEKLKEALDARKEQAKAKLEKMGLGAGVAKGIEALRKMNPKYKLAIAVALAGASVMTGGATSFLSIGFSAASFASRDYEKDLAQKTKDGEEIKKGRMVAKSLVKGLVLALGTSTVFSLVGDALHMSADSEWMKSLKEHFSSTPATTPPVATEVAPSPLDPNPEVELAPHSDVSMEHVPPTPEDVSPVATEVAPSPLDPNPEVELASQPTPDSGAPSSSDTVASPPSTPEDISPSVDQETAPAPIVESSPTFVADVTSPIDIHHDYIMGPNDNTDSILRRVLATVEESKGMTDEQKMQVIGTFKQEWSTWVSGASTPNWDLKAMQAGVPGTKLEHLNHVADALKTVIVRGNPINLA